MKRNGAVLIEVLAAIVILTLSGLSTLGYLNSLLDSQRLRETREAEFRRAERLLAATALLTGRELEQRLGMRRADEFLVWIDRPEPFLFRLGVSAAARPEAELLSTLVYRGSGRTVDGT